MNQSNTKGKRRNMGDRKISLQAVRQFMNLGRRKHSERRDSSTEDEDRYNLAIEITLKMLSV